MSDELLKRLRIQRTTLAFKNGDLAKTFFDLVDENEFHKKTVNDIIELMKEKEKNHE
jgi:hypothetical protein